MKFTAIPVRRVYDLKLCSRKTFNKKKSRHYQTSCTLVWCISEKPRLNVKLNNVFPTIMVGYGGSCNQCEVKQRICQNKYGRALELNLVTMFLATFQSKMMHSDQNWMREATSSWVTQNWLWGSEATSELKLKILIKKLWKTLYSPFREPYQLFKDSQMEHCLEVPQKHHEHKILTLFAILDAECCTFIRWVKTAKLSLLLSLLHLSVF